MAATVQRVCVAMPLSDAERPYAFESSSDEAGLYVLCDLPDEWSLAVSARHEGFVSEPDTVQIEPEGIREHTILISRKLGGAG